MNVSLLRLGERLRSGERRWIVPGMPHPVRLLPRSPRNHWPDAPVACFPLIRAGGMTNAMVDLDRHRAVARTEIRRIVEECYR